MHAAGAVLALLLIAASSPQPPSAPALPTVAIPTFEPSRAPTKSPATLAPSAALATLRAIVNHSPAPGHSPAPPAAEAARGWGFGEFSALTLFAIFCAGMWLIAVRLRAVAAEARKLRTAIVDRQRSALLPLCKIEDPAQAVVASELEVGAGRQTVTQYRVAGRMINSGAGPALNLDLTFLISDGSGGYTEAGRSGRGSLPPLGAHDSCLFALPSNTLIPWNDPVRRNDWVVRIAYEDAFGAAFATIYESRTSTIRFESKGAASA